MDVSVTAAHQGPQNLNVFTRDTAVDLPSTSATSSSSSAVTRDARHATGTAVVPRAQHRMTATAEPELQIVKDLAEPGSSGMQAVAVTQELRTAVAPRAQYHMTAPAEPELQIVNDLAEPGSSGTQVIAATPELSMTAMAPLTPSSPAHMPEDYLFTQESVGHDLAFGAQMMPEEQIDIVIGSSRDDGKMYIGSGQWITKDAWGTLFRATSDSMFCRMASTMFWTPDELKNRSVTGTLSNKSRSKGRTDARPALTPQKLSSLKALFQIHMGGEISSDEATKRMKGVRRHLAQKLADCQRQ